MLLVLAASHEVLHGLIYGIFPRLMKVDCAMFENFEVKLKKSSL